MLLLSPAAGAAAEASAAAPLVFEGIKRQEKCLQEQRLSQSLSFLASSLFLLLILDSIARSSLRLRAVPASPSDRTDTMRASSRSAMAPKSGMSSSRAASAPRPLLRHRVVRSSSKATSSRLGHSHLQASSAASFVARANDEDEEDDAAVMVASEENAKSLSSAAASARAAADARSLSATTRQASPPSSDAESRKLSPLASLAHAVGVLHRFSRPHTMIGTTISILSVSALALVRTTRASGAVVKKKKEREKDRAPVAPLKIQKKKTQPRQILSPSLSLLNKKTHKKHSLKRPRPTSPRASSPPSPPPSSRPSS